MCRPDLIFDSYFIRSVRFLQFRKNRIVILDIEKHEIIHPYFVPSFLRGRKLMASSNSNQLGINLHTGSGSSGIIPLFLERKLMDTGFVYRRERRSKWIPLNAT